MRRQLVLIGLIFGGACCATEPLFHAFAADRVHDMSAQVRAIAVAAADPTIDSATGVRIEVPTGLVQSPNPKQWGRNWSSADTRLSIDTLNFGTTETIEQWYTKLRNIPGRKLSRDEFAGDRFLIEGIAAPGTNRAYFFHIQGHVRNRETRGLSIVMSESGRAQLFPALQRVVRSFQAFPEQIAVATPVSAPPAKQPARLPEPKPEAKPEPKSDSADTRIDILQKQIGDLIGRFQTLENERNRQQTQQQNQSDQALRAERARREKLEADLDRLRKELDLARQPATGIADADFKGDRVALVIGNNAYPKLRPDKQLTRAVNDSQTIGRILTRLGFKVMHGENLGRLDMIQRIDDFAHTVKRGDLAMLFFAGHGVAIAGANYLLPSDVEPLRRDQQAKAREMAISEGYVIAELQKREARVTLLVLDACRDNPLGIPGQERSTTGNARGLTRTPDAKGIFVVYSAGFDETSLDAMDDDDRHPNSVFTRVFAPLLERTEMSITDIVYQVKEVVPALAKCVCHDQNPAFYDQILGGGRRIFLAGRRTPPAASMPMGSQCPIQHKCEGEGGP